MRKVLKIAIIGRTEILYDSALALRKVGFEVVCILTAKEAPEYVRTAADFEALAQAWDIPFEKGPRITDHVEFLRASQADIGVSINYTGVIPQAIIDLFPLGILNAHGGDLPRYRGNACQAWAILNGESRIGLCIHRMIGGELDSGDIVARDYLPIDHTTKVTAVWRWMVERSPGLVLEAVQGLSVDPDYVLVRQSSDPKDALRCYPRRPEDGRIDWRRSAMEVLRLINASNKPYAGAFCDFEGRQLIIWDADLINDGEVFCAVPGQITELGEHGVDVACGVGKIRLKEVELEGRSGAPREWISSIRKRLT
ncbi:MAG: methionyl-tRNA formyltransferase [Burkholderiales bacterium]|nr:methionyl-tRNA formyltransferase [Burkholderiales bacterium]